MSQNPFTNLLKVAYPGFVLTAAVATAAVIGLGRVGHATHVPQPVNFRQFESRVHRSPALDSVQKAACEVRESMHLPDDAPWCVDQYRSKSKRRSR